MPELVADPSTTARWSQAMASHKIIPQWNLRQCCLRTVKDCLLGWSRDRNRDAVDPDNHVDNPFRHFPIHLRQDLLDSLLRLKPHGRELLKAAKLLVCSGIVHFDLGCLDDCKYPDVYDILDTLARTGRTLRQLTLAGLWMYQPESEEKVPLMLKSVPNLRHLKLQETTKENRELELVARFCPLLERLEVMHPSTDEKEILSLVRTVLSDPSCQRMRSSLRQLRLPSSVKGLSLLHLLRAFPNLQDISCTYLEDLLDELDAREDVEWWSTRMAQLKGMHVTHPLSEDTVERLVQWCPGLEEVSLQVQEDMELQPLILLKELKSLELCNSHTLPASYMDEVAPLLKSVGSQLVRLSLERFDMVDLAKIAKTCPNLRELSAQWFTILCTSFGRGQKPASFNLRSLRLRPQVDRRVAPEACELLLNNSLELQHLELYCCYALTDAVAARIVRNNPLSQLRTLILRHGHGLSAKGIKQVTASAYQLEFWDVGDVHPPRRQRDSVVVPPILERLVAEH